LEDVVVEVGIESANG